MSYGDGEFRGMLRELVVVVMRLFWQAIKKKHCFLRPPLHSPVDEVTNDCTKVHIGHEDELGIHFGDNQ